MRSPSSPPIAGFASDARRRPSSERLNRQPRPGFGVAGWGRFVLSIARCRGAGSGRGIRGPARFSASPAPAPFYAVGSLVDVGVYPLTLVTTMLGRAASVRAWGWELMPDRVAPDGTAFRIGQPDLVIAAIELEAGPVVRLTTSFYVGEPATGRGSLEFHGDRASLALGNQQNFDASVEVGPYGGVYEPVELVRPPFPGTAWARGVAEMAGAIAEGRPHRASAEQAAHVVDILDGAAASMADGGRPVRIDSVMTPPPLMPWADGPIPG